MLSNIHLKGFKYLALAGVLGFTACQKEETIAPTPENKEALVVDQQSSQAIPGKYIIVFNESAVSGRISPMASYNDRQAAVRSLATGMFSNARLSDDAIEEVYAGSVSGFSGRLDAAQLASLRKDKRVKYIEQDRAITLAPGNGKGRNKKNDGGSDGGTNSQHIPYGVIRVGGPVNYTGSHTAWVLDTGIDLDHNDLNVDVTRSRSFVGDNDANDYHGHGTHVAGTIGAINNTYGVVGVAAGVPVVAVRVLDANGSGSYSGIIAGLDYVAQNAQAGDVANMSLGGPASQALDDAVKAAAAKGIIFTLAAGNSSIDANDVSPARANGSNIFTISAIDEVDAYASFSNFGNPPIDYAAPGLRVWSTYLNNDVASMSGTSMAAPHAAGVFLLSNGTADGLAKNDPDNSPDPILHR